MATKDNFKCYKWQHRITLNKGWNGHVILKVSIANFVGSITPKFLHFEFRITLFNFITTTVTYGEGRAGRGREGAGVGSAQLSSE